VNRARSSFDCPKPLTVAELVAALAGSAAIVGDAERRITCVTPLETMRPGGLTFSRRPAEDVADRLAASGDAVIIAPLDGKDEPASMPSNVTVIKVTDPREYFIRAVHTLIGPEPFPGPGRSATATVAPDARIGAQAYLGPGVVVGAGAVVGEGGVLFGGVQVLDGVELGDGVIVQANAVIGAHGQSFVRDGDGSMLAMPHYGRVIVGARVRIGANSTVVRGTLRDTVIGNDTSVGNNANVGHNTEIGARCFIGPGVVLTGSSIVGDDTWISAGVIVCGVAVGRNATVGAGAVVTRPVPDGSKVNGFPARVTASHDP
jgi:UDP-3-O-[3-hydroxymyristoyl] glucosamine N-acyltransferase